MRKSLVTVLLLASVAFAGSATRPAAAPGPAGDQPPPQSGQSVLRIYDVRDYAMQPGNYPLNATRQRRMHQLPRDYQFVDAPIFEDFDVPATQPNASQADAQTPLDPGEKRIHDLINIIESTVAPDSWRDNGGSAGSIFDVAGKLYVDQTPQNQSAVREIINDVTEGVNQPVSIQARWVLLSEDELSALHPGHGRGEEDGPPRLDDTALKKMNIVPAARGRLLCIDGQTVHMTAAGGRFLLQVEPILLTEKKSAIVDVLNIVIQADGPSTQPAAPALADPPAQQFHTDASIRLGVDTLIGGTTIAVGDGRSPAKEMYLILRLDAE